MMQIDPKAPLWHLTVEQFLEIHRQSVIEIQMSTVSEIKKVSDSKIKYEYGLKGLAKNLGCSVSTASRFKASGVFDDAIIQNKNTIIIDVEKAKNCLKKG